MRYFILAGLIAGALLGYYVLWSHLIDQVAAEADGWVETQKRQGRDAGYESRRLWGFPYRLSVTFTRPRWQDPQHPLGLKLEAAEVTAHLQLWDMHHVIFELGPQQSVTWRADAASERRLAMTSENGRASLVLDGAGNWLRIAADFTRPALAGTALPDGPLSAAKLLLHARRTGNVPPSTDIALQAEAVTLPAGMGGPLGNQIAQFKLIGNARGTTFGRTPEELLASWRDGGGVIDLQTIAVQWGALKLDGDGTVSLDKQFRPLGAMSGELRGMEAAVDALVAAGRMRGQDAALAKTAAVALAKRDAKNVAYIPAQFTVQDGRLFLGPVGLISLPSILPNQAQ